MKRNKHSKQKAHLKIKKNLNDLLQTEQSHEDDVNANQPIYATCGCRCDCLMKVYMAFSHKAYWFTRGMTVQTF